MRIRLAFFAASLSAMALLGAGCFGTAAPAPVADGGVFRTADGGLTWSNKKVLVTGAKVTTGVSSMHILQIAFDPQDNHTVYLATAENGLLYSLDSGESWQRPSGDVLSVGRIGAISVSPKDKCVVYAAKANNIYKTENCGRDWDRIFFDPRAEVAFTQLTVDWYNPTILYSGTSAGDVFRSQDSGVTWQIAKRVDGSAIVSLIVDPRDSRMIYAASYGAGILKTIDGGNTWTQISKQFGDDIRESRRAIQLVVDPVATGTLFVVSKYGIVRSEDGGDTWAALKLTTPPSTVRINSLAVDPKNSQHMAYTGIGVLQFTTDGGQTWRPEKLPTTQTGSYITYDPVDSKVMYLGTVAAPAKK